MFGGLWMPTLDDTSLTEEDLVGLGAESFGILADALGSCVAAGLSVSDDPAKDAVALWLGLHGLAHQRAATRVFPGPDDIDERMIATLAKLRGPVGA
jgi:hypothetical protein